MAKPFDATLNALIDLRPEDWAAGFARLVGIPPGPSVALDTDLATTLQADKVFRIDGSSPSILHLELQANPRLGIPRELMRYNTLVDHQHNLPVSTVLVLLRQKAYASDQTGTYERFAVDGSRICEFRYHVEKIWKRPVDYWLNSGLGLAPLAMLTDEANGDLESTLDRFGNCLKALDVDEKTTKGLLGSVYVLCGLRYQRDRIDDLFRRLSMLMEESTTYQGIIGKGRVEGRVEGKRSLLFRLGAKRFGIAESATLEAIQRITDAEKLDQLAERILDAVSWDDLLAVS